MDRWLASGIVAAAIVCVLRWGGSQWSAWMVVADVHKNPARIFIQWKVPAVKIDEY